MRAWPPAFLRYQHLPASADKSNTSNPGTSFLNPSWALPGLFSALQRAQGSKVQNKFAVTQWQRIRSRGSGANSTGFFALQSNNARLFVLTPKGTRSVLPKGTTLCYLSVKSHPAALQHKQLELYMCFLGGQPSKSFKMKLLAW